MAEQEQDRSEDATPFKLDQARQQGSVARSIEVSTAAVLLSGLLAVAAFGSWMSHRLLQLSQQIFATAGQPVFDVLTLRAWLGGLAEQVMYVLSPLLALVVIAAVLSGLLQSGPVFSATPLKPDFDRLNPANGVKKLFSVQTLFNAIKTIIKLLLYGTIAYLFLRALLVTLPALYQRAPSAQTVFFADSIKRLVAYLAMGAVFIAIVDLIFTRWEFLRRMRMSRRELKEEIKRREGDPHVRRRRREVQRDMRRNSASLGKVKGADFVVTNPTHLAVAVKYRRGKALAPEVVAKGAGELAMQIRTLAYQYRVPVISNPPLARTLFRKVPLGRPVPVEQYSVVAEILRRVYENRRQRTAQGVAR